MLHHFCIGLQQGRLCKTDLSGLKLSVNIANPCYLYLFVLVQGIPKDHSPHTINREYHSPPALYLTGMMRQVILHATICYNWAYITSLPFLHLINIILSADIASVQLLHQWSVSIYMYIPSNLCKIELENEICCLFSTCPYLWIQFQNIPEYSRMLITQQSGCASSTDCSRNLNLSTKNQTLHI